MFNKMGGGSENYSELFSVNFVRNFGFGVGLVSF